VLATYGDQFYAGTPAVTENQFGAGRAFYVASRNDADFNEDFLKGIIESCDLRVPLATEIPEGVSVQMRSDDNQEWIFVLNFGDREQQISLPDAAFFDVLKGQDAGSTLELPVYGASVLRRNKSRV
ncbi:MAG TPA: beta-galactosidase trimerization domain-containing protein, partial [Abditibacteriaceae bacterium]